ncbi:MAG TPA: UPF0182 family protein [Vicinamibacterales bacterium]|nr:UPF0182 family protein [Vicinamibacterales bacterium]
MRLRTFPLIAALLIIGTIVPAAARFYTDWLWFIELGFESVFLRALGAQATVGILSGAVALALLAANLLVALRALRPRPFRVTTPNGPQVVMMDPSGIRPIALGAVVLIALLIGNYAGDRWETWLYFLNATPFGRTDPILGRDIAFYLFTLPVLEMLLGMAYFVLFLMAVVAGAAYAFGEEIGFGVTRQVFISATAGRHLGLLAAAALLALAFGAWLQIPQMMAVPSGVVTGPTYADVHARIPALWALAGAGAIGAVLAAVFAFRGGRLWPIGAAAALYIAVSLAGSVYAAVIQRFVVAPNEQVRETPFIVHNIQATRTAFGLEGTIERPLSGEARLTRADLERNAATIDNVPLWNDRPLLDTFSQIQEIRTYYDFVAVDNDRYTIDGKYRQIMLSARELNPRSLPSRTWINERLTFTHGYGLTLGPVNEVTREGLPVLFIKDLPLATTAGLQVTQPAIYFGEMPNDHVFVKTKTQEFDYPRGEDNVFADYRGTGGVPLSNVFRRLMFAMRFRSTDTFFSPNLTSDSRVMMYRNIVERVQRIAPFLTYDPDPYLAISGGRLVWMQDVYTTSRRYPYATAAGGVNYIRNSIKVTIDAYDGTTTFHVIDPADPIAQTVGKIFPDLLKPLSAMPEDLRTRLRYPQQIFTMQAAMFATFHMTSPAVFYNREDQWEIPAFDVGGERTPMHPYYTIMKLPGENGAEYIQMLPFTPRGKDNLASWMVARSDGANYGRLAVFQFPKQTVIFGPRQVAARINQDQVISPQITLWNQQGSEVIQGTLLVIPIEESLIYVRPLYLRAAGGQIPELKRVIVAYQNNIVMEETLDAALARIFPRGAGAPPPAVTAAEGQPPAGTPAQTPPATATAITSLAEQARTHYERAMQAQREGNWALYGEEIKKLGEVLRRMREK